MTVAVASPLVEYAGNGVTLEFSAPWRFFQASDLYVSEFDADNVESVKVLGLHYSVTGGGTDAGGTVEMVTAPPTGTRLRIERRTARAQTTDYQTNDSFPAETHERALDKDMMIEQEQDARIAGNLARSLRVPFGETVNELPRKENRAGEAMGFDAEGHPVTLPWPDGDNTLRTDLASAVGASLVGTRRSETGAVIRSLQSIVRETISLRDFTTAVQAFDALPALGGEIVIPDGANAIDATLNVTKSDFRLRGNGVLVPSSSGFTMLNITGSAPTAWTDLSADAGEGTFSFQTATSAGLSAGDWAELRSEALVFAAFGSIGDNKTSFLARVIAVSGSGPYTYTLDTALPYDFLVSDDATVGKPIMRERIVIDGLRINYEEFANTFVVGLRLNYCANVHIINPQIFGSKTPGAIEVTGQSGYNAISVSNCVHVTIDDPTIGAIAWYGVGINGPCRDIRVRNGVISDCRHATSVVQATYGEPWNVTIEGTTARLTTLGCFDTHGVGRDILFRDCHAYMSRGDVGFNLRNKSPRIEGGSAVGCYLDGVAGRTEESGFGPVYIKGFTARQNRRLGISLAQGGGTIENCILDRNGPSTGPSGRGQIATCRGRITNTDMIVPAGYGLPINYYGHPSNDPLDIDGLRIDRQGDATNASTVLSATLTDGVTPDFSRVSFSNCTLPDYHDTTGGGSNQLSPMFTSLGGTDSSGMLAPRLTNCRMTTDLALARGRATLVAGTVTVSHKGMAYRNGVTLAPAYRPSIRVRRVSAANANDGALTVSFTFGGSSSFTITSSNAADTSEIEWEWEG